MNDTSPISDTLIPSDRDAGLDEQAGDALQDVDVPDNRQGYAETKRNPPISERVESSDADNAVDTEMPSDLDAMERQDPEINYRANNVGRESTD